MRRRELLAASAGFLAVAGCSTRAGTTSEPPTATLSYGGIGPDVITDVTVTDYEPGVAGLDDGELVLRIEFVDDLPASILTVRSADGTPDRDHALPEGTGSASLTRIGVPKLLMLIVDSTEGQSTYAVEFTEVSE